MGWVVRNASTRSCVQRRSRAVISFFIFKIRAISPSLSDSARLRTSSVSTLPGDVRRVMVLEQVRRLIGPEDPFRSLHQLTVRIIDVGLGAPMGIYASVDWIGREGRG